MAERWANALASFQHGRMQEAIADCMQILQSEPGNFDALNLAGRIAQGLGQSALAENFLRSALSLHPQSVETLNALGHVLTDGGRLPEAAECLRSVVELRPDDPVGYFNVATTLYDMGDMIGAMRHVRSALARNPAYVPALLRQGMIYYKLDNLHRALRCYMQALELVPEDVNALTLVAKIKVAQGRSDAALPYLDRVQSLAPENAYANALQALAASNLRASGAPRDALFDAGLIDLAEDRVREELAADNSVDNHNFLLKCYLASSRHDAQDYYEESRRWYAVHANEEYLPQAQVFRNRRDPEKRLRVGIIGDYFVSIICRYTLLPFFRLYDRGRLELYCYNFGNGEDELRSLVDHYRGIHGLAGDALFDLIRADEIDIMLDINGRIRTPNYFETLLRQPAPVQVNWYNLPCSVGVKAYNYAISDDYCVRAGEEAQYVERVFRMPTGTICAWDMGEPPCVPPPPCMENGFVTFGCFGDFFKINEQVLAVWADLLHKVPNSRLYLKSNNLRLVSECERVSGFFDRHGIAPARLILEGMSFYNQMKKSYELMDIALDTFPYSSGSTSINALWQGIPVIAIEGPDWRGRSTAAVLAACGLGEFIAQDIDGYTGLARALANDKARLCDLRAHLGKHLAASPQWDIEAFARNFENRLRLIWQDWLARAQCP